MAFLKSFWLKIVAQFGLEPLKKPGNAGAPFKTVKMDDLFLILVQYRSFGAMNALFDAAARRKNHIFSL